MGLGVVEELRFQGRKRLRGWHMDQAVGTVVEVAEPLIHQVDRQDRWKSLWKPLEYFVVEGW